MKAFSIRSMGRSALAMAFAAAIGSFAAPVKAETFNITFAGGHGPHLPWMKMIREFYMPEVDKRLQAGGEHKIVWNEAFGGTVLKVKGVLEGVEEGIAEMGMVYTIFEPANLPLLAVTFVTPFGSSDISLVSKVILDLHKELPEVAAQWHNHNQVFLGAVVADTNHVMAKFPINTLEDLKGQKIGAAGTTSLWAQGIGGVPVQGDFSTHFNNLKTGVYDAIIIISTGAYPIKLHEVAPYFTRVGVGANLIGAISINKDMWDSMPPEVQKVLADVGEEYSQKLAVQMQTIAGIFEKKMEEEGTKFSTLPEAERKKWATMLPNIAKDWAERTDKAGFAGTKMLEAYMSKLRENNVSLLREWDKE